MVGGVALFSICFVYHTPDAPLMYLACLNLLTLQEIGSHQSQENINIDRCSDYNRRPSPQEEGLLLRANVARPDLGVTWETESSRPRVVGTGGGASPKR